MALFSALFAYPAWAVSAPSLDVFMSPRIQAEKIKELKEKGYHAFSWEVYAGTHAYYAGPVRRMKSWDEILKAAAQTPKTAVVLRASAWDKLSDKPQGFVPVQRQTIAEREYIVIARPNPADAEMPPDRPPAPERTIEEKPPNPPETSPQTAPSPEQRTREDNTPQSP
jgi:hypothetical protein